MNLGLWRVWKYVPEAELVAQTFDSISFQIKETADVDAIITKVLELIRIELIAPNGRRYIVPGEASSGYNWGYASNKNPDGLTKWYPGLKMERTSLLDRNMP
jgi:hypothetical protein